VLLRERERGEAQHPAPRRGLGSGRIREQAQPHARALVLDAGMHAQ